MTFVPQAVCFDRTTIVGKIGAYTLESDGTNSRIRYTADAFATPVVWSTGASFSGGFNIIRSASTPGSVLAYATDDTSSSSVNLTYTTGSGPASANKGDTITLTWGNGGGGPAGDTAVDFTMDKTCKITINSAPGYVLNPTATPGAVFCQWEDPPGTIIGQLAKPTANNSPIDTPPNTICSQWRTDTGSAPGGSGPHFIVSVTIVDILGSGSATVRYSSDYGATVGSAKTVGTTPGFQGDFDLIRIGGASIAAASGQVKIATSLGGSYSNANGGTLSSGQPVNLALPFRRWPHGAVQDSATDPDYLLGSSVAISSSCLWMVNGTTGVKTSINPVSGATCVGNGLATVWQSASKCKLAIVVLVSAVQKLYVSVDGGSTWTLSKTITDGAYFLRCRRNDPNGQQLYLMEGTSLWVSLNWGTTWLQDTLAGTHTGLGLDIFN